MEGTHTVSHKHTQTVAVVKTCLQIVTTGPTVIVLTYLGFTWTYPLFTEACDPHHLTSVAATPPSLEGVSKGLYQTPHTIP